MAVISFWNNSKGGNIGQTSSIIATATLMAIEHNYKILVISTINNDIELEKAYGVVESAAVKILKLKESKFNSGIEGIMKLASSGKLTPELIGNYTKIVLKNRLEVVAGKKDDEDTDENEKFDYHSYPDVIKIANKYYDMVFIDLNRDQQDEVVQNILKLSDLIIFNFEQKYENIDKVLNFQKEQEELLPKKKTLYLINKYEKKSKFNRKNIIRNSDMKKNLYVVPYNVMFADMMQAGTTDSWFLNPKVRKAKPEEEYGDFIKSLNELCDEIINKLRELHIFR